MKLRWTLISLILVLSALTTIFGLADSDTIKDKVSNFDYVDYLRNSNTNETITDMTKFFFHEDRRVEIIDDKLKPMFNMTWLTPYENIVRESNDTKIACAMIDFIDKKVLVSDANFLTYNKKSDFDEINKTYRIKIQRPIQEEHCYINNKSREECYFYNEIQEVEIDDLSDVDYFPQEICFYTDTTLGEYNEFIFNVGDFYLYEFASYLVDNLVSHYSQNESSGTTMIDAHHDNDGEITGATVNDLGIVGSGYYFDGVNDYVTLPAGHFGLTNMNQEFSINFFFNSTKNGAYQRLFEYVGGGTGKFVIQKWGSSATDKMRFYSIGGTTMSITGDDAITSQGWHMFTVTHDGSTYRMYIDGVVQSNTAPTKALTLANTTATYGSRSHTASEFFEGGLDELSMYNYGLNASSVLDLYQKITNGTSYPFEEGVSNTAPTLTANATSPSTVEYNTDYLINITATDPEESFLNVWTQFYKNGTKVSTQQYYNLTNGTNQLVATLGNGNFTYGDELITEIILGDGTVNNSVVNLSSDLVASASLEAPQLSNFMFYAINSLKSSIGNETAFTDSNLEEIEYMNVTFTLTDPDGISGDPTIFYTAKGFRGCASGNKQIGVCYNDTNGNWIEFKNGTETNTFKDEGAQGDYISCSFTGNSTTRNYVCQIDEHYNPNVMKWYSAGFNFSEVKWQTGTDQRLTKNNIVRVEMDSVVPLDADIYKLDFRVQISSPVPTEPIEAYACNSSYSTGKPELTPNCVLIATRNVTQLQDNGNKFRALFTQNLISSLGGDGKYILLESHSANPSRNYAIKTYNATNLSHSIKWEYSDDSGSTYTQNTDGYETEMNINWFYNDTDTTGIAFKIFSSDGTTSGNSSVYNMTWNLGSILNIPPIVAISSHQDGDGVSGIISINWTSSDANSDTIISNITLENGGILSLVNNSQLETFSFDTATVSDGVYNLTIQTCENETVDLFCATDTSEITIDNNNPIITTSIQTGKIFYQSTGADVEIVLVYNITDVSWEYANYTLNFANGTTILSNSSSTQNLRISFNQSQLNEFSWIVWSNDSSGNWAQKTVNFALDLDPDKYGTGKEGYFIDIINETVIGSNRATSGDLDELWMVLVGVVLILGLLAIVDNKKQKKS